MREFDALPPMLRHWLAEARLPWSARSVRRVWKRAMARHAGDVGAALASLERAERAMLARDVPGVWGHAHPGVEAGNRP